MNGCMAISVHRFMPMTRRLALLTGSLVGRVLAYFAVALVQAPTWADTASASDLSKAMLAVRGSS